jgi:hypothetical protein
MRDEYPVVLKFWLMKSQGLKMLVWWQRDILICAVVPVPISAVKKAQ